MFRITARIARRISALPHGVLAVLCVLPFWILMDTPWDPSWVHTSWGWCGMMGLSWCAMALPGAIRRRRWWGIAAMALVGAAAFGAKAGAGWLLSGWDSLYVGIVVLWIALAVLAIGEWWFSDQRNRRSAVAVLLAAGGAAVLYGAVLHWIWLEDGWIHWTKGSSSAVTGVIELPLRAVLVWLALPAALWSVRRRSVCRPTLMAGIWLILVGGVVAFMQWGQWPLVRKSILHGEPFGRSPSARMLIWRGRPADLTALREALLTVPSTEKTQDERVCGVEHSWRRWAVETLSRRNPDGLADAVSKRLRQAPSEFLAAAFAPFLAEQKRYEAVPILMRYAMLRDYHCIDALVAMRLPRAALPVMRSEIYWHAFIQGQRLSRFDAKTQATLAALLGKDVGSRFDDWAKLYDSQIATMKTPLPEPICKETDAVMGCIWRYITIRDAWFSICYEEAGDRFRDRRAIREQAQAWTDSVPVPNWDVPTLADLEKEVDAYADRVDAQCKTLFPEPASAPTTENRALHG